MQEQEKVADAYLTSLPSTANGSIVCII